MKISSKAKDQDFSWQVCENHENSAQINSDTNSTVHRKRFDWREDLVNSRDLSKREIDAYGYVLSWIEDWRVRKDLVDGVSPLIYKLSD